MTKIKRFFECLLPSTTCNLKCDYCYVIQEGRNSGQTAHLIYSPEHIGNALSTKRLGGVCYFSICAAGETLLSTEIIEVVKQLLKQGHYVNITTNGTVTKSFSIIAGFPKELLKHLHIAFSLHYKELKRKGWLDVFAQNVNYMKDCGCSILVQMNLYDEYIPLIDEIFTYSINKFGALPQLAATRKEFPEMTLHTSLSREEYYEVGKRFKSPLFDFTMQNFLMPRHEFCYAGDWTACLNIITGEMKKCYASSYITNVYENVDKNIDFEAIGKHCGSLYCVNSSHFLSLGAIPTFARGITYASLRNRSEAKWYTDEMNEFLSSKLCESNIEYSKIKMLKVNYLYYVKKAIRKFKRICHM